jgi:hypothetical protein
MHFKIGDRVRIAVPENKEVERGRAGVKNRDIGIVTEIYNDLIQVEWLTGLVKGDQGWATYPMYLKLDSPMTNRSAMHLLKK